MVRVVDGVGDQCPLSSLALYVCAFTSPVNIESCVSVMCYMQLCMCLVLHSEVMLHLVVLCIGWKL